MGPPSYPLGDLAPLQEALYSSEGREAVSEKPGKQAARMPRSSTQVRVKRAKQQAELRRWPPESCTPSL